MGQEDTLKRQIDKLAKALAKILGKESSGSLVAVFEYVAQVDTTLKEELGYDLDSLAEIPEDGFINALLASYQFNNDHLNLLADVFFNSGKLIEDTNKAKRLLSRAGILYQHLKKTSKNYAIDWDIKLGKIKQNSA